MLFFKFYLRTDKYLVCPGKHPLYVRLIYNRYKKEISLRTQLSVRQWDKKAMKVKNHLDCDKLNQWLESIRKKINDYDYDCRIFDKPVRLNKIKPLIFSVPVANCDSFIEWLRDDIENDSTLSKDTKRALRSQIKKMEAFDKRFTFDDIDTDFALQYRNYIFGKRKLAPISANKSLSVARSFVNRAIRAGKMTSNPFNNFKISRPEGNRQFLSLDELRSLQKYFNDNKDTMQRHSRNTLKCFLFSCYTGLRYSDIKVLKHKHIQDSIIRIIMHKTKTLVTIPVSKHAADLIDDDPYKGAFVFSLLSNQAANRNLKVSIVKAGIKKDITFHSARHTFATTGISLGIPIVVLSKLLGHTDIKTTMIYTKIVEDVKIKEMGKWDEF